MKLGIVIPAHDEAVNLPRCVDELRRALAGLDGEHEILVVDDGSTDETWNVLRGLAEADTAVAGIRFCRNFGKEAAIIAGLRHVRGDAVVVIDADLQHPPTLIPEMVALWQRGPALVVEAVKRRRQRESWLRGRAARLFYRLFRIGSGLDMRNSSDFKLLDRRVVDAYLRLAESRRFFRGLTRWLGFPTAIVEMEPLERDGGESRWALGALLDMARHTIIAFSSLPLRLISWAGIFGLLFSAVLTVQTLWVQARGHAEEGFPTVILLILAMGSAVLLSLGLIGEYVAAIYEEIKARPQYVVLDAVTRAGPTEIARTPDQAG